MTFGPKKLGCCLACGREVYHVITYFEDGPLAGHPNRIGPMLTEVDEHEQGQKAVGCQVEFLLSDGSEADVAFCRNCAARLRPEDYQAAWQACLERAKLSYEIERRRPREIRVRLLPSAQKWPLAVKCWRQESQATGQPILARKDTRRGAA